LQSNIVNKTDHAKSLIQRQIDATDKQIDQLVYELYGLTDEEIKIVEEQPAMHNCPHIIAAAIIGNLQAALEKSTTIQEESSREMG